MLAGSLKSILRIPGLPFSVSLPKFGAPRRKKEARWHAELQQQALRYHRTGSWIAAVLNLLFVLNDLVVIPEMAMRFFVVRSMVSVCVLAAIYLRKELSLSPQQLILVPFLLISVENAYMWSFMDQGLFQMHSLAYAVLFLGASMILLWSLRFTLFVLLISLVANYWFLQRNSLLEFDAIMANGGTLVAAVALISGFFVHKRYTGAKREILLRLRLKDSNERVNEQKAIIEESHSSLTSSIRYSQHIQEAMMPSAEALKECVNDSFVFFRPRDIVSGDFYWCRKVEGMTYIAAVDCTGHGVPGALMSMLGNALLNKVVVDDGEKRPAQILGRLRAEVIDALKQDHGSASKDGMDMGICMIDEQTRTLEFAGAFNPMYLVRNGELQELKADRMPIGIHAQLDVPPFTDHKLDYQSGDMVYLFSDGYPDQFGGSADRKFGKSRFKKLLTSIAPLSTDKQHDQLRLTLEDWQGVTQPIDDVVVLGFRLA